MSRPWLVTAVMLFTALLSTGCSDLRPGASSSPVAAPANASCVGDASATSGAQSPSGGSTGIVVHGSCTVIGAPDTATVTATVQMPGLTARAALDAVGAKVDAVIAGLKAKGINPPDVRAGEIQVTPVMSPILSSLTGVGGDRVTGFLGARVVTATSHDLSSSAPVIQGVTDSVGDSGTVRVAYSVANDSSLRAQALAAAIRQAQDYAKQLADGSGTSLGQLISITDVSQPPTAQTVSPPADKSGQTTAAVAPSAHDGQEIQESVDLVYAAG